MDMEGMFFSSGYSNTLEKEMFAYYIHTYIHTHTYKYIHTYIHSYIHTYIYAYRHWWKACSFLLDILTLLKRKCLGTISIHTYTHTYKYIHTYIHTGIHT